MSEELSAVMTKDQAEMTFGAMYSVYSLPNMILPLFGGVLTDKYGNK